jgi:hypothetical protein
MGALFYEAQNTCCSQSDRVSDDASEDRASRLFDELQRLIPRDIAVVTDVSGQTFIRTD